MMLPVLGIPVSPELVDKWKNFWSFPVQPFPVKGLPAELLEQLPASRDVTPSGEYRDTFYLYDAADRRFYSQGDIASLPGNVRSELLRVQKNSYPEPIVPAWPGDPFLLPKMIRWIEHGVRSSLHEIAAQSLEAASSEKLPAAKSLAGTFAERSGPNCFHTVMCAAGENPPDPWVTQDVFTEFLERRAEPLKDNRADATAGVIFTWTLHGELAHAAVTLGDGWSLVKPSQSWSSPRLVWTVPEVVASWRIKGATMQRWMLV
ncbi:MAG: hypothetical protein Q4B12_08525 [Bowdeniella nasicola]|nr:hypothetical protein [Bowdeniella nasicola]